MPSRLLLSFILVAGVFFDSGCTLFGVSKDDALAAGREGASIAVQAVKDAIKEHGSAIVEKTGDKLEDLMKRKAEEERQKGGGNELIYMGGLYLLAEARKAYRDHFGQKDDPAPPDGPTVAGSPGAAPAKS